MSDVKADLERLKAAFRDWAREVIPILQEFKEDNPTDLLHMRKTRLDVKCVPVYCDNYREEIFSILKALGSEITSLENKLKKVTATPEEINLAFIDLVAANPKIGKLQEELDADMSHSDVLGLIIQLTLQATIQVVEWLLTKLNDQNAIREIKTIIRNVTGEDLDKQMFLWFKLWALKFGLRKFVRQAKNVKASNPTNLESLQEEIKKQSGQEIRFDRFKHSRLIITPAFLPWNSPLADDEELKDNLKKLEEYPLWCELELLCVQILTDGVLQIIQSINNHFMPEGKE